MLVLVLATEVLLTRVFDLNLLREGEGDLLRFFFASCRKCGVDPEEADPAADELLEEVPVLVLVVVE